MSVNITATSRRSRASVTERPYAVFRVGDQRQRAAVIGGSIGGLTAALLLRDAGWEVDVFERSGTLLEGRGGGIVLHPATARYLVERAGVPIDELGVSVA